MSDKVTAPVEGLKFEVSSFELRDHLRERADFYASQLALQTKSGLILPDNSVPRLANQVKRFRFLAEHVAVCNVYRLTSWELQELELLPNASVLA